MALSDQFPLAEALAMEKNPSKIFALPYESLIDRGTRTRN
jgi:hypothetical protein